MHPSKVSETEKSQLVNETHWQYYGTTGIGGNLSLTWNVSALPTDSVTIELWGYEETGEALCGLLLGQKLWACRGAREFQAGEMLWMGQGSQVGIGMRKVQKRKRTWKGWGHEGPSGTGQGGRGAPQGGGAMDAWSLDVRLVLETEKACSAPYSLGLWMADVALGLS